MRTLEARQNPRGRDSDMRLRVRRAGARAGLETLLEMEAGMRAWLAEAVERAGRGEYAAEQQAGDLTARVAEGLRGVDDLALRQRVRGLLQLALLAARHAGAERLRGAYLRGVTKLRGVWRAGLAYPWVGRWGDRSLAEMEVRCAALSSVPVIPRERSLFFRPAAAADRSRPASRAVSRRRGEEEGGALVEEALVRALEAEQVRLDRDSFPCRMRADTRAGTRARPSTRASTLTNTQARTHTIRCVYPPAHSSHIATCARAHAAEVASPPPPRPPPPPPPPAGACGPPGPGRRGGGRQGGPRAVRGAGGRAAPRARRGV